MASDNDPNVDQLGRHVAMPQSPEEAVLERVPNPHPEERYVTRFTVPEFTSICPVTGQPDFAHLVIDLCLMGGWWSRSRSSCICRLFAITGRSMKIARWGLASA